MISRGEITLFMFLESKKKCVLPAWSLLKIGIREGKQMFFICGLIPENITIFALIAEIYVHSCILLLIHIEHFSI
jgi:uncharacterized membrane protein (GlpM family)